jgi:hypothetical protein
MALINFEAVDRNKFRARPRELERETGAVHSQENERAHWLFGLAAGWTEKYVRQRTRLPCLAIIFSGLPLTDIISYLPNVPVPSSSLGGVDRPRPKTSQAFIFTCNRPCWSRCKPANGDAHICVRRRRQGF